MIVDRRISRLLLVLSITASNASARSISPAFVTPTSSKPVEHRRVFSLSAANGDNNDHVKSMLHKCKSVSAALCTAGALLLPSSTPSIDQVLQDAQSHPRTIVERVANVDVNVNVNPFSIQPAFALDVDEENKLAPNAKVNNDDIPLDENDEKEVVKRRQQSTVLDEVWTLVSKYFIDNTYNGQNWDAVRETTEARLKIANDGSYSDEEAMKLANNIVKSLGDKYSRILDTDAYARIQKYDLIGVGATLMPDSDKRIKVGAPPVKNSEAEKNGIKYGDFITAVNGMPTEGRTAFDIIDQIAEDPNAEVVKMTVLTTGPDDLKGEGYSRDVTMMRQFVEVKNPITYKISEKRSDGTVVGYVRITEFNSLVKPKLEEAIKSLKAAGANAYVMDLRGNPGGAFQSAVEIAGLFMDDKIATNVIDSNQVEMPFRTTKGRSMINEDSPMVLWMDGGSASASEVLAGALHDQCRATVMGSNSFGKGKIQAVYGLKNGGGLVLTVAKYITPGGTDIQGAGIQPDVEAKLPTPMIIGLSTDTSKVDFQDAAKRMRQCAAPL